MKNTIIYKNTYSIAKKIITILMLIGVMSSCRGYKKKMDVLPLGGPFTLTNTDGTKFELSSLKGNIVLLFFGYTHCPDSCPMTMGLLGTAYDRLGSKAKNVKTVFISIDPERDNMNTIKDYSNGFKESFPAFSPIGITGTNKEIKQVIDIFKSHIAKRPGLSKSGYTLDHTTTVFVLDEESRTRYLFSPKENVQQLVNIVELLLEEI